MEPSGLKNVPVSMSDIDKERMGFVPFDAEVKDKTLGKFADEQESARYFDGIMDLHKDLFKVHREVRGQYVQPRFLAEEFIDEDGNVQKAKIDRIVSPQQKLIDAGWTYGPFGVELKKSGKALGRPLSQILDYTRAVWFCPNGFNVMLKWCFLWPWDCGSGAVTSICVQNRIGGAFFGSYYRFALKIGGCVPLSISNTGVIRVTPIPSGNKVGSR